MKNKNMKGFSLMELMIVITIIAILSGIVVTNLIGNTDKARAARAKVDVAEISKALSAYKLDNFQYPTANQGIKALIEKPTTPPMPKNYPDGGYIKANSVPEDPWGNPYVYIIPGIHNHDYDVFSFGADGIEGGTGTNADIGNWE